MVFLLKGTINPKMSDRSLKSSNRINQIKTNRKSNISGDNISLASFTSTGTKKKTDDEIAKKLEAKLEKKDYEEELNELDDFEFSEGRDLYKLINDLTIELDVMGKTNYKPIDYILDRFKIQDDILVRIVKLFEYTLEQIISYQFKLIGDQANMQFRLVERFHSRLQI